jgi:ATP-dependent DNA helicase RecQ
VELFPTDEPHREGSVPDAAIDGALTRFGFDAFRPGQREAIRTLLTHRRLLLVAPTGGGKSLIYQLPASILPGTSLVVSPLIALMNDQVRALADRGISATYLASTLTPDEIRRRMTAIAAGRHALVYVAPERLRSPGFRALLRDIDCPLVAVDEAHCISEWGHDFRPEYLEIGGLVRALPGACTLACTATATPHVRDEILSRLGLGPETPQIVRGFARPNLGLRVAELRTRRERTALLDGALAEALGAPGSAGGTAIVYAPTRRGAEEECARLEAASWRAGAYHAGMSGEDREAVQTDFLCGRLEVVVATNAFGMGIDRPDVRLVAHLAPPGSIEAYYQEVGRAGRDGEDAIGLMLISPGDMPLRRRLIDRDIDGREIDAEVAAHKWSLFLELMRWAEGGSCRHDAILRYFGDEEETLSGCGRCDVCTSFEEAPAASPEEAAVVVRKALSAVARLRGRFGLSAATKLLRGESDDRLRRTELDRCKTFGALADRSEEWLLRLLRRCITAGWVDFRGDERPVVVLTEAGRAVVHAERPPRLLLPPVDRGRGGAGVRTATRRGRRSADEEALDPDGRALFEALRAHRLELARAAGVPPYVIASDRSLRDLARIRPRSTDELLEAHGIGHTKAERYGEGFLAVIAARTLP